MTISPAKLPGENENQAASLPASSENSVIVYSNNTNTIEQADFSAVDIYNLFYKNQKTEKNLSNTVKIWIRASRAPFFVATVFPLLLGFAAAWKISGQTRIGLFLLILLASFLVHLATNLANDLFEYTQGVDTDETIGGTKVLQEGKITSGQMKTALLICYGAAFLLALAIVGKNAGLWVVVMLAALSSIFYVAPPIKYGHRALGELSVFINMGLFMTMG
ncbi:MAG: prenyltransferase, partial [Deltaproteobacteria bacterium]|nr:prenyltransferase [Deltaproteobacteria bacterium]